MIETTDMKNKKPAKKNSDKPAAKTITKLKTEKPRKVPSRMGYHGTDEEKNLNPEDSQATGKATVLIKAFSACLLSSRVC